MTPTPRAALVLGAIAVCALLVPAGIVAVAAAAWLAALAVDLHAARRIPGLERRLAPIVSRGRPTELVLALIGGGEPSRVRLRQASTPDLEVICGAGLGGVEARLVGRRRGRHTLPAAAARTQGPLGLGAWHRRPVGPAEVCVYPDLRAARRLALGVRRDRFRQAGRLARGPLGLGTEFEAVRDYQPDDDVRQVNWAATARVGRPMSNAYRIEQDRDVVCLVDAGRLMAAPAGAPADGGPALTRLDAAIDAATAVALVADELEDRVGAMAYDSELCRRLAPRRRGAAAFVRALFDVEPSASDSDYELAFRTAAIGKRALILAFTDLLDEAAARSLIEAVPVLARHHAMIVVSCTDPDLEALVSARPDSIADVHAMAVALDVLDARRRVAARLARAGAGVVEAAPEHLPAACVRAYVEAKRRARI